MPQVTRHTTEHRKAPKNEPAKEREREFREAAERVYRKYGNDLGAFRRDVQRELVKRER